MIWVEWLLRLSFCKCCTLWLVFSWYQKEQIHSLLSSPPGANLHNIAAGQETPSQWSATIGVPLQISLEEITPRPPTPLLWPWASAAKPPEKKGCTQPWHEMSACSWWNKKGVQQRWGLDWREEWREQNYFLWWPPHFITYPMFKTSISLQERRTTCLLSKQLMEGQGVNKPLPVKHLMNWVLFFFIDYADWFSYFICYSVTGLWQHFSPQGPPENYLMQLLF